MGLPDPGKLLARRRSARSSKRLPARNLQCRFSQRRLNGEWRAQGDDFSTFLDDFVAALPQIEFPSGLLL
jgi:hypothetical protein